MRGEGKFLAVATVALLLLALPAAAQAADAYVDFETGVDGPTCGAILTPCKSIPIGIDNAGVGDAVRVDDRPMTSTYAHMSGFNLGFGKSLIAQDFVGGDEGSLPEPDTIIDGNDMVLFAPALSVPSGNPPGTIQGFRIRDNAEGVRLTGPATLLDNTIEGTGGQRLPGANRGQRQRIHDRPRQHLRGPNARRHAQGGSLHHQQRRPLDLVKHVH